MSTPVTRWRKHADFLLTKGPMPWDQLFAQLQPLVPPGRAYRRQKRALEQNKSINPRPNTWDPEHMIWVGQRTIIRQAIAAAVSRGEYERYVDGQGTVWIASKQSAPDFVNGSGRMMSPWTLMLVSILDKEGPQPREQLTVRAMEAIPQRYAEDVARHARRWRLGAGAKLFSPKGKGPSREQLTDRGKRRILGASVNGLLRRGRLRSFMVDGEEYLALGRQKKRVRSRRGEDQDTASAVRGEARQADDQGHDQPADEEVTSDLQTVTRAASVSA